MNKIGIILTTIERPQALKKSLDSIIAVWQDNWMLLIGDQNKHTYGESYDVITKIIDDNPDKLIKAYKQEYNCGISVARNELIYKARLNYCDYILLTADSISFNESMKDITNLLPCFQKSERPGWSYYDLIGLDLNNRIGWEAKINLIPEQTFELEFIEKVPGESGWITGDILFDIWPCDIVRNFWIARTEALIKVPYDEQLIMCEHEDFFWRLNRKGIVVGCTDLCRGTYNKSENTPEYDKIRQTNFRIGKQRLLDKYSLKTWVSYKNIERIQQP
jgi:glycosyltransferase involved in cell wall biosynthesis